MSSLRRETPRVLVETFDVLDCWNRLNRLYFDGCLPPIPIQWSRRLTSSLGLFMNWMGPRTEASTQSMPDLARRCIRLSLPLLLELPRGPVSRERVVLNTLAHEMIHQWQYDILMRRADHGPDFRTKMKEINRQGLLGITIYHSLSNGVRSLARYAWRCQRCGEIYCRRKRTIHPRRHVCGLCHGPLKEAPEQIGIHTGSAEHREKTDPNPPWQQEPDLVSSHADPLGQLRLPFEILADVE
ncbi:MAG: SprT-like domain-containing protein [Nitrospiraceae bacterium]